MIIDASQKRILSLFEKKLIVQSMLNDEVIAFPTDTVYGLGVNGFSKKAVDSIYAIKGRVESKPLILLADTISKIEPFVLGIKEQILLFMQENWPGPTTIILPFKAKSSLVFSKTVSKTLAVRIPEHHLLRDFLSKLPFPVVSTSANISGMKPINNALDIEKSLRCNSKLSFIIDGGTLLANPSRIVSFQNGSYKVIRQ